MVGDCDFEALVKTRHAPHKAIAKREIDGANLAEYSRIDLLNRQVRVSINIVGSCDKLKFGGTRFLTPSGAFLRITLRRDKVVPNRFLKRARMSMVDGFPYKEEVGGSSPSVPTKPQPEAKFFAES